MELIAFVIMPNHVHLLVNPLNDEPQIDKFLSAIKRPYSYRIKMELQQSNSSLLENLTVHERPGKQVFRFWQEGPGYDRNLNSEKAVMSSIDYIHLNPVRKRLTEKSNQWKWSSASWYESNCEMIDTDLPTIHGLPPEFFSSQRV
jgi:putative transposase